MPTHSPSPRINSLTDQDLDQVAFQAASQAREAFIIREQIAQIPDEFETTAGQGDGESKLLEQLSEIEDQLNVSFQKLSPEIRNMAVRIAGGDKNRTQQAEEFCLESLTKAWSKLNKFHQLSNSDLSSPSGTLQTTKTGSSFRGWLRQVLSRYYIDFLRRNKKYADARFGNRFDSHEISNQDAVQEKSHRSRNNEDTRGSAARTGLATDHLQQAMADRASAVVTVQRDLPNHFLPEEEQELSRLSNQCVHLFVYSTGLWNLLSDEKQNQWPEARPTDWEIEHLTSLSRANRYLLNRIEDILASAPASIADNDALEQLRRSESQKLAQNLNRHFWKFLKLDTAWSHLFRHVPPLPTETEQAIVNRNSATDAGAWLMVDCEFAFSSASACFSWLDRCGIQNNLNRNLGRIVGLCGYIQHAENGKITANTTKWKRICELVGLPIDSRISVEIVVQDFFDDHSPETDSQLPLQMANWRQHVDLPLPFETLDIFSFIPDTSY